MVTRQLEKSIAEAAGDEVVFAENGLDALEKLGRQNFELVVTDIMMPRMDDFGLTEAIRGNERTRDLPVVTLTSMESDAKSRRGPGSWS